ncbi:hypothetical protein QUF80_06555 [Desulfococcaceae bacterium HSG8]|nr:hypothetical protein [Desulfococcaceae bacterium HSG8]
MEKKLYHGMFGGNAVNPGEEFAGPPPLPGTAQGSASSAWKPSEPGDLEKALRAVSGWPRVIIPFLVQNIGWFISAFLSVAGCIFLITTTEAGFERYLTISAILSLYTLMLLVGAYILLVRKPDQRTAGNVLITLGMLLIPLSISASVRLIDIGATDPFRTGTGVLMVMLNFGVFYWVSQLASGIMDRSLRGDHARLFMLLAGLQVVVPFRIPHWYWIALIHLSMVFLLGYGLVRFTQDWLKSVFTDKRKHAYFAAGTLAYAAAVSFIHLSATYDAPLPDGYAGPFLMIMAGFLFYADARFKQWTKQYTFLSRFSFAVYGLSILALGLSFAGESAKCITLILGAGVFGTVVWYYLTLPPLYFLLGCLVLLYHQVILRQCLPDTWFLASLPGLTGLIGIHRGIIARNAESLALVCFRSLIILTAGLAGWSFYNAGPGWAATITGIFVTATLYVILGYTPAQMSEQLGLNFAGKEDLRNNRWFYIVPLSMVMTAAYFPLLSGWNRSEQFSVSLVLIALLLTALARRLYSQIVNRKSEIVNRKSVRVEVLLNTALLSGLAAIPLCLSDGGFRGPVFQVTLIMSGGVFLWQSLVLRIRALFYVGMISGGLAGALIKLTYYPHSSAGMPEILIVLAISGLLWHLKRTESVKQEFAIPEITTPQPVSILWLYEAGKASLSYTVRLPLQQAMIVMWIIAAHHMILYPFRSDPGLAWGMSSGLTILTGIWLTAWFRVLYLSRVPMLLGLFALLTPLYQRYGMNIHVLNFAAILYGFVLWLCARRAVSGELTSRLADVLMITRGHGGSGRRQFETAAYRTGLLITLAGVVSIASEWLGNPGLTVLYPLFISMVFFWTTGRCYKRTFHSYMVMFHVVLMSLVVYAGILHLTDLQGLPGDTRVGMLFALLSAAMGVIAHKTGDSETSLYRIPLVTSALYLASIAFLQQFVLIWGDSLRNLNHQTILSAFAAGGAFFLVNRIIRNSLVSLIFVFQISIAILWSEFLIFHNGEPFTLWPGQIMTDQQITLGLLSLGLAFLSCVFVRSVIYARPLWYVSACVYAWALAECILIFAGSSGSITDPCFFFIMGLTLFPLLHPFSKAPGLRSFGIALFFSAAWFSFISASGVMGRGFGAPAWSCILWILANFVLPGFNRRLPKWALAADIWLGWGFLSLAAGQPLIMGDVVLGQWGYWLSLAAYLFLIMRNITWPGLPWLAAGTLNIAALIFIGDRMGITGLSQVFNPGFAARTLIWSNLMLAGVPLWRRYGSSLTLRLNLKQHNLSGPWAFWSFIISWGWLMVIIASGLTELFHLPLPKLFQHPAVSVSVILVVYFIFRFLLYRTLMNAHILILSLSGIALSYVSYDSGLPHLPLMLALWSLGLFLADAACKFLPPFLKEGRGFPQQPATKIPPAPFTKEGDFTYCCTSAKAPAARILCKAIQGWVNLSPWLVIPALLFIPVASLSESVLTLGILTCVIFGQGYRRRKSLWVLTGRLLMLILLHTWPLMIVKLPPSGTEGLVLWHIWPLLAAKYEQLRILFPLYAMQSGLVIWALIGVRSRIKKNSDETSFLRRNFFRNLSFETGIAAVEWGMHILIFIRQLAAFGSYPAALAASGLPEAAIRSTVILQGAGTLVAAVLLMGFAARQAYHSRQGSWVYLIAMMGCVTGLYLRLLLWWPIPFNPWDTFALIIAACGLFVFERSVIVSENFSAPLLRLVYMITLPALLTILPQGHSVQSAALLALGALYLSLHYAIRSPASLYLGVIALNAVIYLRIPAWETHNLLQLYIVPAALSVLVLLHLHRKELKPGVRSAIRLTALSALYVCSTLDVLAGPDGAELRNFILILALSLAGVITGVVLRIRAFLYGGTVFMVLNVVCQLVLFYGSAQTIIKGILLVGLGASVLAGMIWFSIRREEILKHIRIFRADMGEWE